MKDSADVEIGYVVEVSGEKATIELTVDPTKTLAGGYSPGQPGTYMKIPADERNQVIGTVARIRQETLPAGSTGPTSGKVEVRRIAECLMVGTLRADGRFVRGMAVYPNVGQKVKMVGPDELKEIFSEFVSHDFSFGAPVQAEGNRAYLHVDRFFGRHVAVLGTTGCGKSCTVATILQQAIKKYPDTHIIVMDLHGEYSSAFPEDVLRIETDKVQLPYWLLDFDEFVDLTIDPNEPGARNQMSVLRNAILQARQSTDKREGLALGDAVTVDSPIYFELEDMLGLIRGYNIQMVQKPSGEVEAGPLYGTFDRFLIRFESKVSDPRMRFLFSPESYMKNENLIDLLKDHLSIDTGKRMAIVDLSGIPSETVPVLVAVISRLVFEFNLWNPDRRQFPILMVYEEAHNYVPRGEGSRYTAARIAVERIAKEGRKYGIGAIVVSQRPKELSETVLASCNTFVVMRMTNPEDQNYVRHLVPDSLSGMMDVLPSLRTGEALLLGDSVAMPTRVIIDCPQPLPWSEDARFAEYWAEGIQGLDVERIVKRWRARQKDL
jgi:hypothetical protein